MLSEFERFSLEYGLLRHIELLQVGLRRLFNGTANVPIDACPLHRAHEGKLGQWLTMQSLLRRDLDPYLCGLIPNGVHFSVINP